MSDRLNAVLEKDGPGTFWSLEREIEVWEALKLAVEVVNECERIHGEARYNADIFTEDLMRTVLTPLGEEL
jgi:hypothetical protein